MNAVTKALKQVKQSIPLAVLDYAFAAPSTQRYAPPVKLESRMRTAIINDRILEDCNLVGGEQVTIEVNSSMYEEVEGGTLINVPGLVLDGRLMVSAVEYRPGTRFSGSIGNGLGSVQSGTVMAEQVGQVGHDGYTNIEVLTGNLLYIPGEQSLRSSTATVDVIVYNDDNFCNVPPRAYLSFARLVLLATQAYIYNNCIVQMDTAVLRSGQGLGIFRTVIEGYADANELYLEYLQGEWRRVSIMMDTAQNDRILDTLG